MGDAVDVERLRELVDEWGDVYRFHIESEADYDRGMAEGARSAAVELRRVIDDVEEEPGDGESRSKSGRIRPVPPGVPNTPEGRQ